MAEYFSLVCENAGERLDVFLAEHAGLTRSRASALIRNGLIKVSGKTQKPGRKLSEGDTVEGEIPQTEPLNILPRDIPLDIVYEDGEVIVINKPKNMVVHPAPGHIDDTMVNALLFHCSGELSGINGVARPGIIHRLDKDTTGLIIAAKTNEAHISLSEQLKGREIERIYEGVVFGAPDDDGTVNAPIGRHAKNRLKMSVIKNGRDAVTHYRVLERFSGRQAGSFARIEARLETGRTHQIRVHMSHIGNPILGDTLYSGRKQPFGLQSQLLHAKRITFTHPSSGKEITLESQLPPYFIEVLEKLAKL